MKKAFILLIFLVVFSCGLDDETVQSQEVFDNFLPVESIILPDEFQFNKEYQITLTYIKPTDCHDFKNIFFKKNNDSKTTIAIVASKKTSQENLCNTINIEKETTFKLKISQKENYQFKFWKGKNQQGEDIYLEIEVPIVI